MEKVELIRCRKYGTTGSTGLTILKLMGSAEEDEGLV